jgi:ABC-type polysaccharide/polyol phosphate export permease
MPFTRAPKVLAQCNPDLTNASAGPIPSPKLLDARAGRVAVVSTVITDFGDAFSRWRTWFLLGNQDIYLRYKRSIIGPFWISISLAAMCGGMALLYAQIFVIPYEQYLPWLATSLLVWALLSQMMLEGAGVLIESEGSLRNVRIAQPILVMRMVYRNLLIFLHNLLTIVGMLLLTGHELSALTALAAPGLAVVLAVGFFYALALAPLCLRFRDISQVIATVLQIAFFMTPIIWRPEQGRVAAEFVLWNPLYHIIELIRAPLLGYAPTMLNWSVSLCAVAILALLALVSLASTRRRIFLWL